jgi:hypothetical protein
LTAVSSAAATFMVLCGLTLDIGKKDACFHGTKAWLLDFRVERVGGVKREA